MKRLKVYSGHRRRLRHCPRDRKGSGFANVEPGADSFEVGIYQIRDGKTVQSQTFHADSARRYKKNCIFAARGLILAGSWGMRIRHHSDPDRRKRLKLLAAVVGGGALVVMGALSINLQPDRGTTDREVQTVAEPMQTGETATTTTPPVAPETSVAVPPVKAPPYGGG